MIMCAYILHILLVNHAIPQDWMVNSMELDGEKELDHQSEMAQQRNHILAYIQEIC